MADKATGTIPSDIKILNRQMIISVYTDGKVKTPNEISEAVGLSRQTVSKAIEYFVDTGILVPAGKGSSTQAGGRRPKNYELTRRILFAAINAEDNRLQFSLFNLYSEILFSHQEKICEDPSYDEFEQAVKQGAEAVLKNLPADCAVYGISLTLRGLVDSAKKTLRISPYFKKWNHNQSLDGLLRFFPDAVFLTVDKPVRTYARYLLSRNTGEFSDQRVLVLFSRGGMAGAAIDHGHIEQGRNSIIGEFGHMIADLNKNLTVSEMISPEGTADFIRRSETEDPSGVLLRKKDLSYADIMNAEGPSGKKSRICLARNFAGMLRNINLAFDADKIILIGEFAEFSEPFIEMIRKELSSFLYYDEASVPEIYCDQTPLDDMLVQGSMLNLLHEFYKLPELYEGKGITERKERH